MNIYIIEQLYYLIIYSIKCVFKFVYIKLGTAVRSII